MQPRVFPDTAALYPISVADLTFTLAANGVHDVVWSQDLLDEVARVLVEYKGLSAAAAAEFCDAIRREFPKGEISRDQYEDLVDAMTGPDPDDHAQSAAARAGGATVLLSADRNGFPRRDLGPTCDRKSPDRYYLAMLEDFPEAVFEALDAMSGKTTRPHRTVDDVIDALSRAGMTAFAKRAAAVYAPA